MFGQSILNTFEFSKIAPRTEPNIKALPDTGCTSGCDDSNEKRFLMIHTTKCVVHRSTLSLKLSHNEQNVKIIG